MKKIFTFIFIFCTFSCAKKHNNPLIIPPNFAEVPDPKSPEKPTSEQQKEKVARLKELLLKSDEYDY